MRTLITIITLLITIPTSFLLGLTTVSAQQSTVINKETTRTYTVREEYVEVTERKTTRITQPGLRVKEGSLEAFTIFYPIEDDPEVDEKIRQTLDSIVITDRNGNALNFETRKTEANGIIVTVAFPNVIDQNNPETITLTYRSYGLLISVGAIRDIFIPGYPETYSLIDNETTETITTSVRIPASIGAINLVSQDVPVTSSGEFREMNIPFELLLGKTFWIQLGNEQFYFFDLSQEVPKSTSVPFVLNTVELPLPRDITSGPVEQEVFFTELSPEPFEIKTDRDGNLIAVYKVPASQTNEIIIKGYARQNQSSSFDITNAGTLSDIPVDLATQYTLPGEFWEVDHPEIASAAATLKGDSTDVYEILDKTYNFVIDLIDYDFVKKYGINERQGALETLRGGGAVCMEYSDLFISLMRAQGVPARAAFGFGYSSSDYESRNERRINHQWAEVYLPAQDTWINVDTTWGDFGSTLHGGDLNHFYSHVASTNPETPSTTQLSYIGTIQDIPDREMDIQILESLPETSEDWVSYEQAIEEFAPETGIAGTIKTIEASLEGPSSEIDNLITDLTGVTDSSSVNAIKMALFVVPFILILILLYLSIRAKLKRQTTLVS